MPGRRVDFEPRVALCVAMFPPNLVAACFHLSECIELASWESMVPFEQGDTERETGKDATPRACHPSAAEHHPPVGLNHSSLRSTYKLQIWHEDRSTSSPKPTQNPFALILLHTMRTLR